MEFQEAGIIIGILLCAAAIASAFLMYCSREYLPSPPMMGSKELILEMKKFARHFDSQSEVLSVMVKAYIASLFLLVLVLVWSVGDAWLLYAHYYTLSFYLSAAGGNLTFMDLNLSPWPKRTMYVATSSSTCCWSVSCSKFAQNWMNWWNHRGLPKALIIAFIPIARISRILVDVPLHQW